MLNSFTLKDLFTIEVMHLNSLNAGLPSLEWFFETNILL